MDRSGGSHFIRELLISLLAAVVGVAVGFGLEGMTGSLWTALILGIAAAGIAWGVFAVLAWLVWPYAIDMDAALGDPDDIFYKWHRSARWQRFSAWTRRHAER